MKELWDIYDANRNKTGKTVQRDVDELKEGEYHIVVVGITINSKNEILISRRAPHKTFGLMWEFNGGSIKAGETSLEGIVRELKEELGIEFSKEEAMFYKEIKKEEKPASFKDLWVFRKDIDIRDITFPDGEAVDAKWVTINELMEMVNRKECIPMLNFGLEDYNDILKHL